jgi:hypothetical protein
MSVIPFIPKTGPRIIIDCGTVVKSDDFPLGLMMYWLEYQDGDIAETVWTGASYEAAREAAREWRRDGARLIDRRQH